MPKRLTLRPFRRGEKQTLYTKLHDRKLPTWAMHRYQIIALVRAGVSVFQASYQVGSSPKMAYLWLVRFNESGFRDFEQSSNPAGRPSELTQRELQLLIRTAQKRPTDVGLPFTNWSMTKLQDYLVKRRHFPAVTPEWLRQLLHHAEVSWQHTKTWKQSHDPAFAAKKSVFWRCMLSVLSTVQSFATINWVLWNCVLSRASVGRPSANHSVSGQPIRASAVPNSCTAFMMSMPIVWWAAYASARPPKTSRCVSPSCELVTRSRFASMW
jgi:transposase